MSWPAILLLTVYLLTTALCVYAVGRGYADAKKCSTERIISAFGEVPSDWKAFTRPGSLRSNFVSIMVLAVTIVPVKFIAVIFIHVIALFGLYFLPTQIFLKLLSYCCITVREQGQRLPASEIPTIVSNHVSYFDILIMLSRSVPVAFVAKKAVAKYPVSGDICTSLGSVYVSRAKGPEGEEASVMEGRSRYQLCVFAEGTTSNGTCLMHYHDGAFDSMLPVQPVYLEYSNLNLSFTCLGIIPHVFLVMALPPWFSLTCTVHWLPPVTPDPDTSVHDFAEKTRREVAAAGNLRLDNNASYRSHVELEHFFFGDTEKVITRKMHDIAEVAEASKGQAPDSTESAAVHADASPIFTIRHLLTLFLVCYIAVVLFLFSLLVFGFSISLYQGAPALPGGAEVHQSHKG
ncbi:Lysophosphatidylcholine acyltransferase 2 [Perkinsus olseni]|uniref:Lysophosphatidylcholine acyltransferase 2 n=1 Tax=Perkinsus olseni TaxID=32597 RepID=A0A7J6NZ04_PEROL|nr:Lysophosphatidylcholine acyltransferase 2 [Perkinsus olseni]